MPRRDNLTHLVLAIAAVLGLTPVMLCVDAQAQIASRLIGMGTMKST